MSWFSDALTGKNADAASEKYGSALNLRSTWQPPGGNTAVLSYRSLQHDAALTSDLCTRFMLRSCISIMSFKMEDQLWCFVDCSLANDSSVTMLSSEWAVSWSDPPLFLAAKIVGISVFKNVCWTCHICLWKSYCSMLFSVAAFRETWWRAEEEALSPQNVLMLRSNVFLFVSAPGEPRDAFTGCKFMSESGVHVTKRAHSGYSPPNVHTLFWRSSYCFLLLFFYLKELCESGQCLTMVECFSFFMFCRKNAVITGDSPGLTFSFS